MFSSERHYSGVGELESSSSLHVVPENDPLTALAALPSELSHPEEQPPTAPTVALGSLVLAPHDEADKDIYDRPFYLTKENFSGFYSYWYPYVISQASRRMYQKGRGLGAQEDVAQCVFESLLVNYVETDKCLGTCQESSPQAILTTMTRNKVVDHFRGELRHDKKVAAVAPYLQTKALSAEELAVENLEREETVHMVQSYLHNFSPKDQEILLQASSGIPQAEIAEQLQITPGSLRVRLCRARQKLKDLIDGTLEGTTPPEPPKRPIASPPVRRRPQSRSIPAEAAEQTPNTELVATDDHAMRPRNVHLPVPNPAYIREDSVGQHEALFTAAGLSPDEVDILTWSDVDGSSVADLGSLLDKSKGAVDAQLQRLRHRVREYTENK